ncbi:hypothetical protein V1505DRAFT_371041 [Lipomyces doorenjongii]
MCEDSKMWVMPLTILLPPLLTCCLTFDQLTPNVIEDEQHGGIGKLVCHEDVYSHLSVRNELSCYVLSTRIFRNSSI